MADSNANIVLYVASTRKVVPLVGLRTAKSENIAMTDAAATARPGANEAVFPLSNQAILAFAMAIVAMLAIATIRTLALSVTRYQVDVYEDYTRDALAANDYTRAIEIATGAIRSGVNRSDHLGRAHLLRAMALQRQGEGDAALEDALFSNAFFQDRYYFATDKDRAELAGVCTELAKSMLESGNIPSALEAFGMAAATSGRPVEYLSRLRDSLNEQARALLWPDGTPRLTLRNFGAVDTDAFSPVVEEQGRSVASTGIEGAMGANQNNNLQLELTAADRAGRSVYSCPVWMPLSNELFSLRLIGRAESGAMPQAFLGFWFDSARESAHTNGAEWMALEDGWQACTLSSDFMTQLETQGKSRGFAVHDGILNKVGFEFSQDSASKVWMDRIEIVLPS